MFGTLGRFDKFHRFGRSPELSAPKGRRLGRLDWRDSRFISKPMLVKSLAHLFPSIRNLLF